MKEIILEAIQKNSVQSGSVSANVAIGNNWVKKLPKKENFAQDEINQAKVMSLYPDLFPETILKVINDKGKNKTIILQKKLNIYSQQTIYLQISDEISENMHLNFRYMLESIADFNEIPKNIKKFKFSNSDLQQYFNQYIKIAKNIYQIFQKYKNSFRGRADLHSNNFGLDGDKIKCIDFVSPNVTRPTLSNYHPVNFDENYSEFGPHFLTDGALKITRYALAHLLDIIYGTNLTKGIQYDENGRPLFTSEFSKDNLTGDGIEFIAALDAISGKSAKYYYNGLVQKVDFFALHKDNIKTIIAVIKKLFPSSSVTTMDQWINYFHAYENIKINDGQIKYTKDLFNKSSSYQDTTKLDEFAQALSKAGIPIKINENKNMKNLIRKIIAEAIEKNELNQDGSNSDVYIGKNYVKKVKHEDTVDSQYNENELYRIKLMQKYASTGIFPKTIIKFNRNAVPVIVQEKIDVAKQRKIFKEIDSYISEVEELEDLYGFFYLLDGIGEYGLAGKQKYYHNILINVLPSDLLFYYNQYIDIILTIRSIAVKEKINKLHNPFNFNIGQFGLKGDKLLITSF